MSFFDLGVNPAIVKTLSKSGINDPFPIQKATLPDAISGKDVLGRGQTGSGKTLAFGLALLTKLANRKAKPHHPLAIILSPTRELAMQINDVIAPLAQSVQLNSRLIAGGMPYGNQIQALRQGVPILVATPGRLIDLMEQKHVSLSETEIVVLDEADQMADMGFLPAMKEILNACKPKGQRLLFSATLDRGVDGLVKKYLNNPVTHSVDTDKASVSTMEHHVLVIHPNDKEIITAQIAAREGKTILFVRTQHGADKLAQKLAHAGVPVGALHGGKSQSVRTRTLAAFKSGATPALVATDVAARGIHVDDVSLVVHVDPPQDPKDYLHRAGRTARAGESGVVVTLTTTRQQNTVRGLTDRAGVKPKITRVRPLARELMEVTGAREPSGVPWIAPATKERHDIQKGGPRKRRSRPRPHERRRRPRYLKVINS
jgi:superfamily II DNA/RNA helicase